MGIISNYNAVYNYSTLVKLCQAIFKKNYKKHNIFEKEAKKATKIQKEKTF